MSELRGKRALVMGLGVNGGGLGVTRFLVAQGAHVTVTDLRSAAVLQPTLAALAGLPVEYVLGEHRTADFTATDLVIRNPGVPRESPFLQAARAAGAAVEMEMTLFFRLCPGPILGITGTRGKTTTTLLTGAMLRKQFPDTVVAGNLRVSALEQLPQITPATPVVLELSSWQLEGLDEACLSPQYSCVTNMSPDHLDRYPSMTEYAAAKQAIVRHQTAGGVAVLNMSDPLVREFAAATVAQVLPLLDGAEDAPLAPLGAVRVVNDLIQTTVGQVDGRWQTVCGDADIQLPGHHNRLNIAAAAGLALAFGVGPNQIRTAVRGFTGVADRLETIRTVGGVRYVNDTTATTPTALVTALRALTTPVVLIAGGADKKLAFDGLADVVAAHAHAVVLLAGTATAQLAAELATVAAVPVLGPFPTLAAALAAARAHAVAGDTVLLSPGCASFGMFVNEFDRGAQFRMLVEGLV